MDGRAVSSTEWGVVSQGGVSGSAGQEGSLTHTGEAKAMIFTNTQHEVREKCIALFLSFNIEAFIETFLALEESGKRSLMETLLEKEFFRGFIRKDGSEHLPFVVCLLTELIERDFMEECATLFEVLMKERPGFHAAFDPLIALRSKSPFCRKEFLQKAKPHIPKNFLKKEGIKWVVEEWQDPILMDSFYVHRMFLANASNQLIDQFKELPASLQCDPMVVEPLLRSMAKKASEFSCGYAFMHLLNLCSALPFPTKMCLQVIGRVCRQGPMSKMSLSSRWILLLSSSLEGPDIEINEDNIDVALHGFLILFMSESAISPITQALGKKILLFLKENKTSDSGYDDFSSLNLHSRALQIVRWIEWAKRPGKSCPDLQMQDSVFLCVRAFKRKSGLRQKEHDEAMKDIFASAFLAVNCDERELIPLYSKLSEKLKKSKPLALIFISLVPEKDVGKLYTKFEEGVKNARCVVEYATLRVHGDLANNFYARLAPQWQKNKRIRKMFLLRMSGDWMTEFFNKGGGSQGWLQDEEVVSIILSRVSLQNVLSMYSKVPNDLKAKIPLGGVVLDRFIFLNDFEKKILEETPNLQSECLESYFDLLEGGKILDEGSLITDPHWGEVAVLNAPEDALFSLWSSKLSPTLKENYGIIWHALSRLPVEKMWKVLLSLKPCYKKDPGILRVILKRSRGMSKSEGLIEALPDDVRTEMELFLEDDGENAQEVVFDDTMNIQYDCLRIGICSSDKAWDLFRGLSSSSKENVEVLLTLYNHHRNQKEIASFFSRDLDSAKKKEMESSVEKYIEKLRKTDTSQVRSTFALFQQCYQECHRVIRASLWLLSTLEEMDDLVKLLSERAKRDKRVKALHNFFKRLYANDGVRNFSNAFLSAGCNLEEIRRRFGKISFDILSFYVDPISVILSKNVSAALSFLVGEQMDERGYSLLAIKCLEYVSLDQYSLFLKKVMPRTEHKYLVSFCAFSFLGARLQRYCKTSMEPSKKKIESQENPLGEGMTSEGRSMSFPEEGDDLVRACKSILEISLVPEGEGKTDKPRLGPLLRAIGIKGILKKKVAMSCLLRGGILKFVRATRSVDYRGEDMVESLVHLFNAVPASSKENPIIIHFLLGAGVEGVRDNYMRASKKGESFLTYEDCRCQVFKELYQKLPDAVKTSPLAIYWLLPSRLKRKGAARALVSIEKYLPDPTENNIHVLLLIHLYISIFYPPHHDAGRHVLSLIKGFQETNKELFANGNCAPFDFSDESGLCRRLESIKGHVRSEEVMADTTKDLSETAGCVSMDQVSDIGEWNVYDISLMTTYLKKDELTKFYKGLTSPFKKNIALCLLFLYQVDISDVFLLWQSFPAQVKQERCIEEYALLRGGDDVESVYDSLDELRREDEGAKLMMLMRMDRANLVPFLLNKTSSWLGSKDVPLAFVASLMS